MAKCDPAKPVECLAGPTRLFLDGIEGKPGFTKTLKEAKQVQSFVKSLEGHLHDLKAHAETMEDAVQDLKDAGCVFEHNSDPSKSIRVLIEESIGNMEDDIKEALTGVISGKMALAGISPTNKN